MLPPQFLDKTTTVLPLNRPPTSNHIPHLQDTIKEKSLFPKFLGKVIGND